MAKRTAKVEARRQESCRAPRSKFGAAEDWGRCSPCRPLAAFPGRPPALPPGLGSGSGPGGARCPRPGLC